MYDYNIEKIISDLNTLGFSKLPSVKELIQENKYFDMYKDEGELKTYKVNSKTHLKLIEDMDLGKLFDRLYTHGKELKSQINREDRYFVSRFVKSGQSSESYRGHFDSHFITIVIPIQIPKINKKFTNGELLMVPNLRGHISSEILNFCQKLYFKKLNSKKNYLDLVRKSNAQVMNFCDYEPLVFYGNRTFHGNFPLLNKSSDRLTFLCHLYDTSPRFSIWALLRKLRNR